MRVVFFGTPQFAADVLEFLCQNQTHIVAVISKPDKPQGRAQKIQPVPVKLVAEKWKIPIHQPKKVSEPEFAPLLKSFEADLFVVVAYGEILKQHVLDIPKKACINLHASLLPKYRGAAPIQHAIIEGEQESGVTIMHMVRKMDAGEMIAQVKTHIDPEITYGDLQKLLCTSGSEALLKVIREYENSIPPCTPQDESQVTMAPKIELEDCHIDWQQSSKAIHNLVRGVNPEPGAWCLIQIGEETKRLKIFATRLKPTSTLLPGQCASKKPLIGTGQGDLELLEVQLEGKKRMPAADFFRGLPTQIALS